MLSKTLPLLAALCLVLAPGARADEATIRKNLGERYPQLAKLDEVTKAPIAGLFEIRVGTDIYYTDEAGNYLLEGHLIDTRTKQDLTEARIARLTAIDFASLPLKDAVVIKQGTGARRIAVFGDPNCGYCKKLEKDLVTLKDVTIYTFLLPILGPDSVAKSRDIWCSKDAGKVWRAWMVDGTTIPKTMGQCDSAALQRNQAMGEKYRVRGTPAVVFEDGTRAPGAIPTAQIEQRMAQAQRKS